MPVPVTYPCVVPGCKAEVNQVGFLCQKHQAEEDARRHESAVEAYKARRAAVRAALRFQESA